MELSVWSGIDKLPYNTIRDGSAKEHVLLTPWCGTVSQDIRWRTRGQTPKQTLRHPCLYLGNSRDWAEQLCVIGIGTTIMFGAWHGLGGAPGAPVEGTRAPLRLSHLHPGAGSTNVSGYSVQRQLHPFLPSHEVR